MELMKENKKLTNVGISLHKQGQVLDHLVKRKIPSLDTNQGLRIRFKLGISDNLNFTDSLKRNRTEELLEKKKRLQALLSELKLLVQAKQNLAALQPTLKLQEQRLSSSESS